MNKLMSAVSPRRQADDACPMHSTPVKSLDRWELLTLVTAMRREIGLTDRDVMVLRAHLTVLPQGPLIASGMNVSFMNVTEILQRACGMDARRFRRGEARLEQVGLIRRHLSANGRRFPERNHTGQIVQAYGIDLAPIFELYPRLLVLQETVTAENLALRQRKNALSAGLQEALRQLASSGRFLPDWADALRTSVRNALRRTGTTQADLDALAVDIAQITAEAEMHLPEKAAVRDVIAPCPARLVAPTDKAIAQDIYTPDDGQIVRHIESKPKDLKKESPFFDLRRIHLAWAQAVTLREFYPAPPSTERDLAAVLIQFSSFIGLGQTAMLKAMSILGWDNTILVVDYLASRTADIVKPEGYLTSMLRSYTSGQPVASGRVIPRGERKAEARSAVR
ncbi:helix-turn-helix domain-containing protein [Loktanella sp. DJP18]|uniref:helix-turn-helix domain-containing protein n=1 Tax=Loktanella sp. DJP18 TaxID=3409788 RepID=UPI003BB7DE1D